MQDLVVKYFYDNILGRNVYGVVPDEKELEQMELIAKMYMSLSQDSKDYIRVRLDMIGDTRC